MWHSVGVIRASKTTRAIAATKRADLIAEILVIIWNFSLTGLIFSTG